MASGAARGLASSGGSSISSQMVGKPIESEGLERTMMTRTVFHRLPTEDAPSSTLGRHVKTSTCHGRRADRERAARAKAEDDVVHLLRRRLLLLLRGATPRSLVGRRRGELDEKQRLAGYSLAVAPPHTNLDAPRHL